MVVKEIVSSGVGEVCVTEHVELLVIKTVVQFAIEITGMDKDHTWTTRNTKKGIFMLLVLAAILLIASIDYVLGNKISDAISEYIEHICIKLCNKYSTDTNRTLDVDVDKENCDVNPNKEYYGKATLELARMTQKKLEESENNKIGEDDV